jgi:hypothetical protein
MAPALRRNSLRKKEIVQGKRTIHKEFIVSLLLTPLEGAGKAKPPSLPPFFMISKKRVQGFKPALSLCDIPPPDYCKK